jgi:hypothetical protein
MLIFARCLVSIIVLACGLCVPAFADTPSAESIDALRAKADHGNAEAQLKLGGMYHEGKAPLYLTGQCGHSLKGYFYINLVGTLYQISTTFRIRRRQSARCSDDAKRR